MKRTMQYICVFASSIALAACGFAQDQPASSDEEPSASGPYESTGLALTSDALGDTDIQEMRFTVEEVDCSTGESVGPEQTATTDYEDMYIPGGIEKFEGEPLDEDSQHIFADSFFTVDAGCFNVTTQPLRANGNDSKDCFPAHKDDVRVNDGVTTEILLVNQCKGPKRGGLDVAGTINHPPEIGDLTFDDSKFITSCQPLTEVCLTASDSDDDPLTFEWSSANAPKSGTIESVGETTQDSETGLWTSCAEVETTDKGEYSFKVDVFDMDGNGKKIEKVLEEQHPDDDHASRDSLRFPMYGMKACPAE